MNIFKRWFSSSKEQDIDDSQNPWAGLASYEDPETAERKLKFCGRDDDSYDLARLIMGNVFVTLYGKSGIGKTSLLNAGVFPELRDEQYAPVSIRLGMRDEEHPQSYQTMIIEAVERVAKKAETVNVIDEQKDQQSIDYLWNYFARHRFYDKYDEQTTPVIVFDQFEEVFRGHRNEAEILLRQLDYLNDKDHALDNSDVDGQIYRYEQNFRFVVSIREDDLYRLEDSIDNCYLPALKRCRYRLRSLSEEGARDAILIPGEGLFNESEKDSIANAIIGKSRNDDGSISTNIISLLCSRIYVDFKRSSTNHITLALVENFIKGNPFERFYNEATLGFSNKEKSYIEEHFVDSTSRRNSIPESDFLLHVKNGAKLLEGKNKILQCVSTSSDCKSNRVELIHDSFCEPLSELKKKREQRRRAMTYAVSAAVVLICLGVTALIFSQRDTISQREKDLEVKKKELELKNAQLERKKAEAEKERNSALLAYQERTKAFADLEYANKEILKQKQELGENVKMLTKANRQILERQVIAVSNEARLLSENGNPMYALEKLKEVFCYYIESGIAYPPEFEQACRTAYDSIYYARNKQIGVLHGHTSYVRDIAYSNDGRIIATGSNDESIILWNSATGSIVRSWHAHNNLVSTLAFSKDDSLIVSGSYTHDRQDVDGTVKIWESKTGKCLDIIPSTGETVGPVCFSGDGKKIAASYWNGKIIVYDVNRRKIIYETFLSNTYPVSLCLNKDGSELAYSIKPYKEKGEIGILNIVKDRKEILLSADSAEYLGSISYSPNYDYLAGAYQNRIIIWNNNYKLQKEIVGSKFSGARTYKYQTFKYSDDGNKIVAMQNCNTNDENGNSAENQIQIWDIRRASIDWEEQTKIHYISVFSPFKSNQDIRYLSQTDRTDVAIWNMTCNDRDLIGSSVGWTRQLSYSPHEEAVIWNEPFQKKIKKKVKGKPLEILSYDDDGNLLCNGTDFILSDSTGMMILYDIKNKKSKRLFIGHKESILGVELSKNKKRMISISSSGHAILWDFYSGKIIQEFQIKIDRKVQQFVLNKEGSLLAYTYDNNIYVKNLESKIDVDWVAGYKVDFSDMMFSPNSNFLITVSDNGVYDYEVDIWDVKNRLKVNCLHDGNSYVSASISSNGKYLVTGTRDGKAYVFDFNSLKPVYIYNFDSNDYWVDNVLFINNDNRILFNLCNFSNDKVLVREFLPLETILK